MEYILVHTLTNIVSNEFLLIIDHLYAVNYICNCNWCLTFIAELGKSEPKKVTYFLRYKAEVNVKYKVTLNWKDID